MSLGDVSSCARANKRKQENTILRYIVVHPPFNSPFVRQQLHALPQYAASPLFMNYVQWRGMGSDILALAGDPTDPIEPAYTVVVGMVVSNRPYLETAITHRMFLGVQGNFSPAYADPLKTAKAAKLQFKITKPVLDPDFGPDYDINYNNFLGLQDKITKTPLRQCILSDTNNTKEFFLGIKDGRTIRFNYPLWEPKTDNNDTPERNAITTGYNVNANCTPWFDLIKQSHQLCCLPLYNANENLDTKPETWERKLVGAMVEVTFSLKHYHMATNSQRIEASDTFSAKVESLSILRPPPPVLRSPFKNLASPKKPPRTPQTPSRSQQIKAARSFVPFPNGVKQPDFTLANGDILSGATVPVSSSADSVGTIMLTSTGPSSGSGEDLVAVGSGLERAHSAGTRTRRCGQDEEDHADADATGASPTKKSRR
ncbi:hypothetical protein CVT25_012279 [Psilocybe cyanescens]|uniref:Uncharacterized protein n=1 Tax=Psilocybe cyanescens TaxID=93625 RepID=A0A409XH80_PSICY|nr:hypothetical protein CVT25_012279 [Psilocybe cyanescens]